MLTNECHNCGNYIEFPDQGVGEEIQCPHCRKIVTLTSASKTTPASTAPSELPAPTFDKQAALEAKAQFEDMARQTASLKPDLPHAAFESAKPRVRVSGRALGLLGAFLFIGISIVLVLEAHKRSRLKRLQSEHTVAVQQLAQDAAALRAPRGFLEARWLMSSQEVMRVAPNVKFVSADIWGENRSFYDRPCMVTYHFHHNSLLRACIRFLGASSPVDYEQVQARLEKEYGRMPAPAPAPAPATETSKRSIKKIGHFAIEHSLSRTGEVQTEEVLFYIRGGGNPRPNAKAP